MSEQGRLSAVLFISKPKDETLRESLRDDGKKEEKRREGGGREKRTSLLQGTGGY